MMTKRLNARLDRNGQRVLCGVRDCGHELARVFDETRWGEHLEGSWQYWNGGRRKPKYYPRFLVVGPGFTLDDQGTWRLSNRSQRRRRRGKEPRFANPIYTDRIASAGRVWGLAPRNLPATIVCPQCGVVQTLDSDTLRVCEYLHGIGHGANTERWAPRPYPD